MEKDRTSVRLTREKSSSRKRPKVVSFPRILNCISLSSYWMNQDRENCISPFGWKSVSLFFLISPSPQSFSLCFIDQMLARTVNVCAALSCDCQSHPKHSFSLFSLTPKENPLSFSLSLETAGSLFLVRLRIFQNQWTPCMNDPPPPSLVGVHQERTRLRRLRQVRREGLLLLFHTQT